ncbi:acyl-CoA carboxylase epsilon subunit, partial [Streptomyces europaeiscabiei]
MKLPDIRVEKGHAEPEEVAAITALLLARAAAQPVETPA